MAQFTKNLYYRGEKPNRKEEIQWGFLTSYQLKDYWEGWDELIALPQKVYGVRMKDGSEHFCGGGTGGFEDQENMIYFTEFDISNAILDLSQVESLMFHKGWEKDENGELTVQTFYYLPIG